MAFDSCIAAALAGGLIDEARAGDLTDAYRGFYEDLRRTMTPIEAEAEAGRRAFAAFDGEVADRRRQTFLSLAARDRIEKEISGYAHYRTGKADPYLGATGLYDRLLPGRRGMAVEQQREYWRGQMQAEMDAAFRAYKRDLAGRQGQRANDENVVAEAFGRDTGDAEARAIAQGWIRAREKGRAAFNLYGGHIGKLQDYGFPQYHSQRLVNEVSFEAWRDFVGSVPGGVTAMGKYADTPLTGDKLEAALRHMYENIVTDGWAGREASSAGAGSKAFANRRAESRFLIFNSPEGWLAYQRRFGEGNVFDVMMHHIEGLARDVAHMEVLGPNPSAQVDYVIDSLMRQAEISRDAGQIRQAKTAGWKLRTLHDHYTGAANIPAWKGVAEVSGDIDNIVTANLLHAATLAAVPGDFATSRIVTAFNGVPYVSLFRDYARQFSPKSDHDRMLAGQLGLTAESYARTLHDSYRLMEQSFSHEWSKWFADRAMFFNGLTPHTDAMRRAVGINFSAALANMTEKGWADLAPEQRRWMERYRIGAADWSAIRETKPYTDGPAKFLRPADVAARADLAPERALALSQKLADAIMTETEFAVPSSSLAGRAYSRGHVEPGSIGGVVLDSALKFKTFGMTYLLSHGRRMLAAADWQRRLQYLGSIVALMTVAGAMTVQMREIANGRDPKDMTAPEFWGKALIAGGGLSVYGDYFYSFVNSAGRSLVETLAGPNAGLVADTARLAFGQPMAAAEAQKKQSGVSGLVNNTLTYSRRWGTGAVPFYAQLVLNRAVYDALQEWADPNWKQRKQRIENWYRKQFGQKFWWRPGEAPARGPDLSAAAGGGK